MKVKLLTVLFAAAILVTHLYAADDKTTTAAKPDAATELKELITRVQAKISDGKRNEADFSEELKGFDDLLANHKGEKTDDVAQIPFMKAMVYFEVFDKIDKGTAIIEQIKRDFPDTQQAKRADKMLASIKDQEETKKISRALVEGSKFPDFDEKDVAGEPLSIGNYKGKVVMIDFWATWCGPCVGELPNVLDTYKKHHDEGFNIIGISLDKDKEKLTSFTKERKMPWQQFFDGKMWSNKLAVKYGVQSIPMTYLLDGEGKIIGKGLRGEELEDAVAKAVAKK